MTSTDLIEIFCILDEFCKYFEPELRRHTLDPPPARGTVTALAACLTARS